MKKLIMILASGSALVAAASPAMAQDAASTFTGARVGAILGYDATKAGSSVDNDTTDSDDQSIDGLVYGGEVGYDFAVSPNFVLGAEAEYTESTAKTGFDRGDFEGFGIGNVKAGRDLYAGVRAGFRAAPSTLVYAKAGYTNARFDVRSSDGTVDTKSNIDTDGYRLGAGVEQAIGTNTFAKVEYRYSNYGEGEVDYVNGPDSGRFDLDTDRHQVVVGFGLRF
ncbi:MAG: outer membrane beta-barrel protein [Novosphingobium sp.]|nr:outer membrane beta-barrel protein [Novosphingobium sp.]